MNKKLIGFKYISWQRVIIQEYAERKKKWERNCKKYNNPETSENTKNKQTNEKTQQQKQNQSKQGRSCMLIVLHQKH